MNHLLKYRLFLALDLPSQVQNELYKSITDEDLIFQKKIRPTPPQNLHVTLHFLGDVNQSQKQEVGSIMDRVREVTEPFELCISSAGFFPNSRNPRILWAGFQSSPEIFNLHRALEKELLSSGFRKDAKAYRPHITIARIPQFRHPILTPDECNQILKIVDRLNNKRISITGMTLYQSILSGNIPEYRVINYLNFNNMLI